MPLPSLISKLLQYVDANRLLPDVLFFGGLALLCYGAERLHSGSGPVIGGVLLILCVRPLTRWWR
jgi:hypothetical protein